MYRPKPLIKPELEIDPSRAIFDSDIGIVARSDRARNFVEGTLKLYGELFEPSYACQDPSSYMLRVYIKTYDKESIEDYIKEYAKWFEEHPLSLSGPFSSERAKTPSYDRYGPHVPLLDIWHKIDGKFVHICQILEDGAIAYYTNGKREV